MKTLVQYAYHQASPYKTDKSIYNIIIGKKSHQTFFDAVTLNLFTLFGIKKDLTWETFTTYIKEMPHSIDIPTSNKANYHILVQTFENLQLLIQTLSYLKHEIKTFMPTTSHVDVHQNVKKLYHQIKKAHKEDATVKEIYVLFECLNTSGTTSVIHYFLTGYDEVMYTPHQVSLIEKINPDELSLLIYHDLYTIYTLLEDTTCFPILSQCRANLEVSSAVYRTYLNIKEGQSIEAVSKINRISINTVYDHIVDLFINNYFTDLHQFIKQSEDLNRFVTFYHAQPNQRLKFYKTSFNMFSYFEIKLIIICIAKGVL
ncbi:helix-turn-helix domain-containing protein [Staphylococcus ratti]|uniref:Helix-turn-helix domain-containing protein n=1 Tax=Staphylococcus ratti TaxID=2892440 RepID=A0ABY3P9Z9_9STAP|nr:helix-turn-helix domain-containing protein [Staphylococcus ratti]UEX89136.1 helix-turn-helix domain-containing protein [Staphylococcus ratti]